MAVFLRAEKNIDLSILLYKSKDYLNLDELAVEYTFFYAIVRRNSLLVL